MKEITPLTTALDAVRGLAIEVLGSARPGRFHEAARICDLGQQLQRTLADNASTFDDGPCEGYGAMQMPMPRMGAARHVNAVLGGHDDQAIRDIAQLTGPFVQTQAETARAQWAASEAQELERLLALVEKVKDDERLQKALKQRIDVLTTAMEKRNDATADLVSADVSRRHSARGEGSQEDDPRDERAHADGDGGGQGLAQTRYLPAAVVPIVGGGG